MYGAGDAIAQYVENINADEKDKKELFDLKLLAVFTIFGTVIGGPVFLMKLNNPAVADILDQLEEQLDQLFEGDDRLQDYDSDTKYQYSLISKIFHKIRQVSDCAAAITATTTTVTVLVYCTYCMW